MDFIGDYAGYSEMNAINNNGQMAGRYLGFYRTPYGYEYASCSYIDDGSNFTLLPARPNSQPDGLGAALAELGLVNAVRQTCQQRGT